MSADTIPIDGAVPEPEGEAPPVVLLDDCYVRAMIGVSISVSEPSRACYSLDRLAKAEMKEAGGSMQEAQARVATLVQRATSEHGAKAPLFIDDSLGREQAQADKPRIVRPGGWRPKSR